MAKASFAKLNLKINDGIETIVYNNSKENITIEIIKYLPIEEKINLINNVINNSVDDNDFYNPIRLEIFKTLEIIYKYTNLNFTDKMKENPFKLYDILVSSKLYQKILEIIPKEELEYIHETIETTIKNIYDYKNSAAGILHLISSDYSNLNLDLNTINDKITDPEQLAMLKEIIPLLGLNQ